MPMPGRTRWTRRETLAASAAGAVGLLLVRPSWGTPDALAAAIREFTGGATLQRGRVKLDLPPLVENGNSVSVTVRMDSPMTAEDHVRALALFTEQNPQPNVAIFHLSPRSGRAIVTTRMRLATSQKVIALAQHSDGSFWSDQVDVIVTLAACVEG
ncbi:SoxY-related AACIE arm protein [uncultured Ferrovibrio sp.]|jgi:sulfur-oxidizing protein SoxY|uniref:SoxY-related AACIE arm protein n=1 Tax=uncultured Ferrovibrio sp. TaxID=1576913 RepID=UPI00262D0908|nr:SoxY-related AACIE arm protein [uncultured Ferrovibrio sp.]